MGCSMAALRANFSVVSRRGASVPVDLYAASDEARVGALYRWNAVEDLRFAAGDASGVRLAS